MTRWIATLTFDPAQRAQIVALIPAEQARVKELMDAGTLEALYLGVDNRAWLVLQAPAEQDARQALESLPLYPYAQEELAALRG